jgi:replication fork protection complex subunit Tof1/Swi1
VGLHARADRSAVASAVNSDDEGDTLSDLDDQAAALFEPGGPTSRPADYEKPKSKKRLLQQRKAPDLTEAERLLRQQQRDAKDKEKNEKIKSALRITDSDDEVDEEKDAEFFALEELRRKKISGVIRNALLNEVDETAGLKKNKRKAKGGTEKGMKGKKRKTITIESDSEQGSGTEEDEEMRDVDAGGLGSDGDDAAEDTPMDFISPLKANPATTTDADEDEEAEDIVQTRPVRARLPFLDDSDSD